MTVYVVRHGQNEDNAEGLLNGHRDRPLTELGREQARTVAGKLANHDIRFIYSSPLCRARETAEIIAARLGLPVTVDPDLVERDFGCMTGQPVESILDLPPETVLCTEVVNYFLNVPGAEDFPTVYERALRVLARLERAHAHHNVALVCHGDIGKMLRAAYHGWEWRDGLTTPYLDNTGVLELHPTADVVE